MGRLVRHNTYEISYVLALVRHPDERATVEGTPGTVNTKSLRMRMFAEKGVVCCVCGLKGAFFATERSAGSKDVSAHFNLYAVNQYGHEILMTRDHIIPKSRGGQELMSNMQPMCCKCNSRKGSKLVTITPVTHQEDKHQSVIPDETPQRP